MQLSTLNRQRLEDRVGDLTEQDDIYDAMLDLAADLYDGTQDPRQVVQTVIEAINEKFGW